MERKNRRLKMIIERIYILYIIFDNYACIIFFKEVPFHLALPNQSHRCDCRNAYALFLHLGQKKMTEMKKTPEANTPGACVIFLLFYKVQKWFFDTGLIHNSSASGYP